MSGAVRAGAAALALAAAAACTPSPAPSAEPGADASASEAPADTGRVELTGVVVITAGPAGRGIPTLVPDGERGVVLTGAAAEELGVLGEARVRVAGRRTPGAAPGGGFEVASYELLEMDGQRPHVGVVRVSGGGTVLVLPGDSTVRLVNAPAELTSRPGAKVWVVGRPASGGFTVLSYGVIRAP